MHQKTILSVSIAWRGNLRPSQASLKRESNSEWSLSLNIYILALCSPCYRHWSSSPASHISLLCAILAIFTDQTLQQWTTLILQELCECRVYRVCFLPVQHTKSWRLNESTELNINLNGSKDSRATLSHKIVSTDIQALPEWRQQH